MGVLDSSNVETLSYPTLLILPETWPCMLFLFPSTGLEQALAHSFALRLPSDGPSQKRPPRQALGL